MDVDWVVAIVVFLIFVTWSFTYYLSFFGESRTSILPVADYVKGKIKEFVFINTYMVPVVFNSSNSTSDSVLYIDFLWHDENEKNSTTIYLNNNSLPCRIEGNRIYWVSNLSEGMNYFIMRYAGCESNLTCNSTFSITNKTQAVAWSVEKGRSVSQGKINNMTSTDYNVFKNNLMLDNDFRIKIRTNSTTIMYGKSIPLNRDVHVFKIFSKLWEDDSDVNLTISVW